MRKIMAISAVLLAGGVQAGTISINFVGNGPSVGGTEFAGLVDPTDTGNPLYANTYVTNWNNVSGSSGTGVALALNNGIGSGATVNFATTLGTWVLPGAVPTTTGNDKMMKGYLDADGGGATVTLNNLTVDAAIGSYSVLVYFDGENGGDWRVGRYSIGATFFDGEDSENTDWANGGGQNPTGYFQIPTGGGTGNAAFLNPPPGRVGNNNEGNYVVFSGLTAPSFTLTSVAQAWGGTPRAPINGIQIVGVVPEPATAGLLAAAGVVMLLRRRRR